MSGWLPFRDLDRTGWERLASAAGLLTWLLSLGGTVLGAWLLGGVDFRGYYAAAHVWLQGGNPYDYTEVSRVLQAVTGYMGNNPFYYPPWFVFIVAPFGGLPFQVARLLWALLNGVLLWAGCRLALGALRWHLTGWRRWAVYLSALYLFGWMTLRFEQAAIFVFACLMAALVFWQRRRAWPAALCLVLAMTKPQPAWLAIGALLVYGLITYRAVVRASIVVLTGAVVTASLLVAGWWQALLTPGYGRGLAYTLDGPDTVVSTRINTTFFDWAAWLGVPSSLVTFGYAVLVVLVATGLLYTIQRRSGLQQVAVIGLIGSALLAPYALQYDYVPLIVVLFFLYRRNTPVTRVLLLAALSVPLWERPISDGYWIALCLGLATATAIARSPRVVSRVHGDAVLTGNIRGNRQ